MPSRTRATALECCVLGLIAQEQPCTAYSVRQRLSTSLSTYWSGSAGAIYPLLDRMVARRWILVREEAFGTRVRKSYRVSATGRRQLDDWLHAPIDPAIVAHTHDPVRTPVFFFDLVEPKKRRAYLQDAVRQTSDILDQHRSQLEATDDPSNRFERLGVEGVIAELEARLIWLQRVLATL